MPLHPLMPSSSGIHSGSRSWAAEEDAGGTFHDRREHGGPGRREDANRWTYYPVRCAARGAGPEQELQPEFKPQELRPQLTQQRGEREQARGGGAGGWTSSTVWNARWHSGGYRSTEERDAQWREPAWGQGWSGTRWMSEAARQTSWQQQGASWMSGQGARVSLPRDTAPPPAFPG